MKNLNILFVTLLCLIIFGACEKTNDHPQSSIDIDDIDHSALVPKELRQRANRGHGKPFMAKFFTKKTEPMNGEEVGKCSEEPFIGFNLQVGDGTATHLGKFNVRLWFCGFGSDYKGGEGVFTAANGDELYFNVPATGEIGHVLPLPFEHPLYELYFVDPFDFTGGTGRFAGASGQGFTLSFVDIFDDGGVYIPDHQTDHRWYGRLILPEKK